MSKTKALYCLLLCTVGLFAAGCGVRFDMQDQPRYKAYKKSDFFRDGKAMRELPEGTVARGLLRENKAFYTGKVDNPDPNAQAQSTTDASGNTIMTTFPNVIDEFPVPVTKAMIDRGQERYNIYCIVCHGAVGAGDGMIVRRGFFKPPTYHDDRLRNAPVGHFFDVITNGFGRMNPYGHMITAADRWAIVAYIRTLQASQNPAEIMKMNSNTTATPGQAPAAAPTHGGAR
jgi:mono/diheme cytochrome c family protein